MTGVVLTGPNTVSRIKIAFSAVTIPITNQATPMVARLRCSSASLCSNINSNALFWAELARAELLQEATAGPREPNQPLLRP